MYVTWTDKNGNTYEDHLMIWMAEVVGKSPQAGLHQKVSDTQFLLINMIELLIEKEIISTHEAKKILLPHFDGRCKSFEVCKGQPDGEKSYI